MTNPLLDQLDAAAHDAHQRVLAAAEGCDMKWSEDPEQGIPGGPVGDRVRMWDQVRTNGPYVLCSHLVASGPQPIIGLLGMPGHGACRACVPAIVAAYETMVGEAECDACRRELGKPFHDVVVERDVLVIFGSVCIECGAAMDRS
jgi:hypothetical protein